MGLSRRLVGLLFSACQLACIGCMPAWLKYDQMAENLRFSRAVMATNNFNIVVYKNQWYGSGKKLHVYLDGDGSPWTRNGSLINSDPTPRQYLVLQLMSIDPAPAILIGRPCYHGFSQDSHCHPLLWTHARYSQQVVSAVSDALQAVLKENNRSELVLIGYSGGGTLAQLVAEKFTQTRAVVTLAGNLDLATWTQLHDYTPLEGSLNPAERPPLPGHILQIHYVGSSDQNTPPSLAKGCLSNKDKREVRILEGVDHSNGWLENWPGILFELDKNF